MQLLVVFGIQQDFSEQKVHQLVDVLCAISNNNDTIAVYFKYVAYQLIDNIISLYSKEGAKPPVSYGAAQYCAM